MTGLLKQLWKHQAVQRGHVVNMTRGLADGQVISVATCQCGWDNRVSIGAGGSGYAAQDAAINAHWAEAIAKAGVEA